MNDEQRKKFKLVKADVVKFGEYVRELETLAGRMRFELALVMDMSHLKDSKMQENTPLRANIHNLLEEYDDFIADKDK